ncbi:hypothetical protein [Flavobacterium pectinovorum]|uniref:hypothetical protein n=1 Tax=Flavobacterium pectinovorum TaxID=29533 RepID=UPI001FABFC0C|nr:hypothetical protein [Flavobacterium pectinovorum]MCI9845697.1 hypothetical protein [Flavobacterium pectinovorum]
MKKILTLFAVVGLIAFSSCEGPEGPPGEPGQDGLIGQVIQREVDFNSPNYSVLIPFGVQIYPEDVVLVYHRYEVDNGNAVWRLIPQTYYMSDGGALDFNYDFTRNDVNIWLAADFPLSMLSSDWTQNQVFRIVIVPGEKLGGTGKSVNKPDYSDYEAVIKKYNIDDSNVKDLN